MKKRFSAVLAGMLALCIMLTGCMSESVNVAFKEDGSGEATIEVLFSKEFMQKAGITEGQLFSNVDADGYINKRISGDDYIGISKTSTFEGIDDLNSLLSPADLNKTANSLTGIEAAKSVKDNKEIITLTCKLQSDTNIIKTGQGSTSLNLTDEQKKELETAVGAVVLNISFTFPDGVTGVTGLTKKEYRLDGNTIEVSLKSGTAVKNFTISGALRDATYQRFPEVNKYDNRFKDVPTDAWYRTQLIKSFNIGIIAGTSATTFSPNDYLTISQVVVMAARTRSLYEGDGAQFKKVSESDVWYKPYLDYAVKMGIVNNSKEFSDYNRPATRAEMVHIFAKALPSSAFVPVNAPKVFTDVSNSHKYYSDIMNMYSAGVIMGTSETQFSPNSNVTRAQAAVIIARVAEIGDKVPR